MEKEFVPYEQALDLKELGFNQRCLGQYNTHQGDKWVFSIDLSGEGQYPLTSPACITPLYQQAFRWFREKHDKYGVVNIDLSNNLKDKIFVYMVEDKLGYIINRSEEYNTYEEAESACLKKLIEIVKNK